MAWPYWLFSSIFKIFGVILFIFFTLFIFKSNINSYLSTLPFRRRICESKVKRLFTQLKPPIKVFSKTLTCSASVGRAIKHLLLSLWTQPLKELAGLHFFGLNLKSFFSWKVWLWKSHTKWRCPENYKVCSVHKAFKVSLFDRIF